jgi:hypothetical protein
MYSIHKINSKSFNPMVSTHYNDHLLLKAVKDHLLEEGYEMAENYKEFLFDISMLIHEVTVDKEYTKEYVENLKHRLTQLNYFFSDIKKAQMPTKLKGGQDTLLTS